MGKRGIRVGATIGMGVMAWQSWKNWQQGGANKVINGLTGYNMEKETWNIKRANALIPGLVGIGLSWAAAKTGINRYTPTRINL